RHGRGPCGSGAGNGGIWRLFGAFFMNLNFAFEIGAILNGDSLRGNIAYGEGRLSQFCAVASANVAFQLAMNDNDFGIHIGTYLAVGADRETASLQFNRAFDLAVDV